MRKAYMFMMLSLDGYFEGPDHDLSWHNVDDEFNKFAIEQLEATDLMLFGRRTYQLMESFWPRAQDDPTTSMDNMKVARLMNNIKKVVFSKTLEKVEEGRNWKNVELAREMDPKYVKQLKEDQGKNIWVGGSDLAVSFVKEGLIDEFRFMVNPVVIGDGTPILRGLEKRLDLELTKTRTFGSGNTLLYYKPKA